MSEPLVVAVAAGELRQGEAAAVDLIYRGPAATKLYALCITAQGLTVRLVRRATTHDAHELLAARARLAPVALDVAPGTVALRRSGA